ncbi:MAG: ATP phosphoribosyltransferase regulatory subunit [Caulobacteraceae bacterium]|nr:ATP phosphoribosyltransferase regulatory subunit [Caulobacteraceae bacterium]
MRLEAPIPTKVREAVQAPLVESPVHLLDAPVLQPLGLLLDLAGETLRERLFVVQTPDGGPEQCLRPDFTIPALRAHIASGRPEGRYFYSGHAFRVAPPGSTRAEEFPQFGIEAFESGDGPRADAEIAARAWRSACAGGRDDLTLVLGDVGLFAIVVDALDLAPPLSARLKRAFSSPRRLRAELDAAVNGAADAAARGGDGLSRLLAQMPEPEAVMVLEEIWALAGIEPVGGRSPAEIVHRLGERTALARAGRLTPAEADLFRAFLGIAGDPDAALEAVLKLVGAASGQLSAARQGWARRVEVMAGAGVPRDRLRFSAAFGRAFGYYDGMVFEVRSAALGDEQPVAAGGRYDGLPARLGASLPTGAVGCMVRPGRAWAGAQR